MANSFEMIAILVLIQAVAYDLFCHLNYYQQINQIYHHYLSKGYQYLFNLVNLHPLLSEACDHLLFRPYSFKIYKFIKQ